MTDEDWPALLAGTEALANATGWQLTGLRRVINRGDYDGARRVLLELQAQAAALNHPTPSTR